MNKIRAFLISILLITTTLFSKNILLSKGWNLSAIDYNISTLPLKINISWQYTNGIWKYNTNNNKLDNKLNNLGYSNISDINSSIGTWFHLDENTTITQDDNPIPSIVKSNIGWDLRGTNVDVNIQNIQCVESELQAIWKYDNNWSTYSPNSTGSTFETFTVINANQGYWTYCDGIDSSANPPKLTGKFIDSAVQGIFYSCSDTDTNGTTDINGSFEYDENCGSITFSLGGVILGITNNIPFDQKLFITDLVGLDRDDTNNSEVLNLSRFIQSLDDNNNTFDGINITNDIITNLADSTLDFSAETPPTISEINTTIENISITLISEEEALAHITYTLNSDLDLNLTSPPPSPPILTSTPTMTNADITQVEVNGQPKTSIYINEIDSNIDIPEGTAKIEIDLNTSSADGDHDFNITLIDDDLQQSDALLFTILKDTVTPIINTLSNITIDEGNTVAVDINATDTNSLTYSLTNVDSVAFEINSTTGNITFLSGLATNYEHPTDYDEDNIYIITANITDGINSIQKDINITVNNTAEIAPTLSALTTSVIETAVNGDLVGNIVIDTGDTNVTNFELNETNGSISTIFEVANDGTVTVLDNTTIDYELTTSYSLKATAYNSFGSSNIVDITINVTNTTDTSPTIDNFTVTIDENIAVGTIIGDINITDPGDSTISAFTMYESDGTTLNNTFIISNSGTISVKTGATINYETNSSYNLKAVATNSAGDSNSSTVSITVTDLINETVPTIVALTTSVVENTVNTTVIGNIEITTPLGDSNITSFTVGGTDASTFDINTSGAISVANVNNLDYETTTQFNLTVYANNDAGVSNSVALVIDVNNSAEIVPVLTTLTTVVSEDASNNDVVGSISINPGDTNVTVFDINDTNGSESTIFTVGFDGEITVLDNSTIDYETTPSYSLTATAYNDAGVSNTVAITINVSNSTDKVPEIDNFTVTIDENIAVGTIIGDINITDPGDSTISAFTMYESDGTTLNNTFIISNSGTISVKTGATINYETNSSYNLKAVATNSAGDSNSSTVSITVTDLINETVPTIVALTTSVVENTVNTTVIGNIEITTPLGDSNITSFTVGGTDASTFDINTSGAISVANVNNLDYETTTQFNLTVYANNDAGVSNSVALVIDVNNSAEIVPVLTTLTTVVSEDASNNDVVGSISINPGDTNVTTFDINDTNGSESTIFTVGFDGEITVLDNSTIDYETTPSYSLTATAYNDAGVSNTVAITINVSNSTDKVPEIDNFTVTIDENIAVGTIIGDINITDPGDSTISAFTMYESDGTTLNNTFIISNSGTISVKTGATINYETNSSYNLKAVATNSAGDSNSSTVSITVTDLINETVPTIVALTTSVVENTVNSTVIGNIEITTPLGDSNITSFTVGGVGASTFNINNSGAISVADVNNLDYETTTQFNLTVYANNDAGVSNSVALVIDVNNSAEIVPVLTTLTTVVSEDASNNDVVGSISINPGDTNVTTFDINDTNGSESTIFTVGFDGEITVLDNSTIDYETTPSYSLTATAYNDAGVSNTVAITINVSNSTDKVPEINNFTVTIDENIAVGTIIGDINITDPGDSTISAFTMYESDGTTLNNTFIISNSGTISVKTGATINYETNSSYNLKAVATNSAGDSNSSTVSITVTDLINETVPTIVALTTSVVENTVNTTVIGNIEITTPLGDSNITSFTVGGTDASTFDINTSGAISVANVNNLDYETTTQFNLTVYANNDAGVSNSVALVIDVNNTAEIVPVLTTLTTVVSETASNNDVVGSISINPGDTNVTVFDINDTNGSESTIFTVGFDGEITVLDNSTIDYETTPSYSLTATAYNDAGVSNTVAITINVSNSTDKVPEINNFTVTIDENIAVGTIIGDINITDPGDSTISAFTMYESDGTTLNNTFIISNSGTISVKTGATINYETNSSYNLKAVATNSAGDSNSSTVSITVTDLINETVPTIVALTTSVVENTVNTTVIGNIEITTPLGDSNITSFTVGGTDASTFDINTSGAISVANVNNLDYETTTQFNLTVYANNDAGVSNSVALVIDVNNSAEIVPVLTTLTTVVSEDASNNDVVGSISINPGDTNVTVFDINDTNGSESTIFTVGFDGEITVLDNSTIDYETTPSYSLTATAYNDAGVSNTVAITINVSNSTDKVPEIDNFTVTIDENIAVGTIIGDINITDPGDSTISAFTMYESDGTTLNNTFIISNSGTISVKTGATINYETNSSYNLKAVATNSAGDSNSSTVSITVTDLINETVPTIVALTTSVVENTVNSTVIGNIEITTPLGDSNITSFTVGGVGASTFNINNSGAISVADVNNLDYETTTQFNLTVYANNDAGVSNSVALVIDVNNSAEIVPVLTTLTTVVSEDASNNDVVGSISINPGDTNVTTFDINDTNGSESTIFTVGFDGEITVLDNSTIDYETTPSYSLTATAYNDAGVSNTVAITINVSNSTDKVPEINNFTVTIDENIAVGTIIGDINITDPGDSTISAFTMYESDGTTLNNTFIISNSGTISVKTGATINYETNSSYDLRAVATNSAGDSNSSTVSITVTDLINETVPTIVDLNTSVVENTVNSTVIGNIEITTPLGDSNITSFTIGGVGASTFNINNSGAISVADVNNLDYETTTQFNLTVYANNDAGVSNSIDLVIDVNNTAEIVPVLTTLTTVVSETASNNDVVGSISINPGDTNVTVFDINDTNGSESTIFTVGFDGEITVLDNSTIDYETTPSYSLTATAYNDAGVSNTVAITINVSNSTDKVPEINNFTVTIDENIAVGTIIGDINITDPGDSTISAFTMYESDGTTLNNTFIISNSGTISVKTGATINYETNSSYNLKAVATNSAGDSNSSTVSITVTDLINETVPTIVALTTSVVENTVNTTVIGNIEITTPLGDSNITSFTVGGTDASTFDINTSGAISVANVNNLDYETTTQFNLTVYANNDAGVSNSVALVIDVNNSAEIVPVLTTLTTVVSEDASNNDVVGSISINPGDTNVTTFDINDTNGSESTIFTVGFDGEITVLDNSTIDYETTPSYSLTATAYNDAGVSNTVAITINVSNSTDKVPEINNFTVTIDENIAVGTIIGDINITDPGDSTISAFTMYESDGTTLNNTFIISNSGTISVKTGATINYETNSSYNLKAVATNSAGDSNSSTVSITVTDLINETVPTIVALTTSVVENTVNTTVIGNIEITTPLGDSNITSFTVGGTDASTFDINTSGAISVANVNNLDYETTTQFNLTVYANNDAGVSNSVALVIDVNNTAEIVPVLTTLTTVVSEDASNNDVVGSISINPGDTNVTTFDINDTNGSESTIFTVGFDGEITVLDNSTIDYETTPSYSLTATAYNDAGVSNTVAITINVSNSTDKVPEIDNFTVTIDENIAVGTIIGDINITDPGDSTISAFTMYESDGTTLNNTFIISNSGTISVKTGATINYETNSSYNLKAVATNSAGDSNSSTVSITVTDLINETVPTIVALTTSVVENTVNTTVIGNIEITTPLGDSNITSFTVGGTDASTFDINTSGAISVANVNNLDYETTTQFNLTVYANNDAGVSNSVALVIDVNNSAEIVPVLTTLTTVVSETASNNDVVGSISINPGDTNVTVFDINDTNGSESTIFTVGFDGEITVLDNSTIDYETTPSYSLTATAYNDAGVSNTVAITINVSNTTDKVPEIDNFTVTIDENIAVGTIIGDINITDPGDSTISAFTMYESDGTTLNNTFIISNSGTISVKTGATINYETNSSYDLRAVATNSAGDSNSSTVSITVTDLINETVPTIVDLNTSVVENTVNSTVIGNIEITTPLGDSNITSFTIGGVGASTFNINNSGAISVADVNNLDYETTTQFNLTVYANNDAGVSNSIDLVIDVNNTAEIVPVLTTLTTVVSETASNNDVVGSISINPGDTNVTVFDINDTNGSESTIFTVGFDGEITVLDNSTIDYETTPSYSLTATAYNDAGVSNTVAITINVSNSTDKVPEINNFTVTIDENIAVGTIIGDINITDPGDSTISAFTMYESDGTTLNNTFIISNSGTISVKTGATINYETNSSYNLKAVATNSAGDSNSSTVSITVTDLINETVPTIVALTTSVVENTVNTTVIGNIEITTPLGDSNITSFTVGGTDASTFDINTSGAISVANVNNLDYETTTQFNLTVYANNDAGVSNSVALVIDVNNSAEIVPVLTTLTTVVSEDASNNDVVGSISINPGDTNVTVFDINDTNGSESTIFTVGFNGEITVLDNSTIDYETTPSYSLTATAYNDAGVSNTVAITINVSNTIDTSPTIENFTGDINENVASGTIVGDLNITNSGDSSISAISIKEINGTVSSIFAISNSGTISVISAAIDYETRASYDLRALATNSNGDSNEANITITINDLTNEDIPVIVALSTSISEDAADNTLIDNITITTQGDSNISSFTISGSGSTNFEINTSGHLSVATGASLDYETAQSYSLTIYATNTAGDSNSVSLGIDINNTAEIAPTLSALTTSVIETAANGDLVGNIVIDTGDTNVTNFELNETNGSICSIFTVANDGTITVLDNTTIDYETTPQYSLKATATNSFGKSNIVDVTININNVVDTSPTITNFTGTVNENVSSGTIIGDINITNIGDSAITSFSIKEINGTVSDTFSISNSGTISVISNSIDYETGPSYDLRALATNFNGDSNEANITITVNDLTNEDVPVIVALSTSVEENATDNTLIDSLTITTPGDSNITSFTVSGTGSANFDINTTGHISVAVGAALDYETTTAYSLTVYATNSAGDSNSVTVDINITNVTDSTATIENFTINVDENIASGTVIGTLNITQGDSNITSIDLNNSDGSVSSEFEISTAGVITLKDNITLDYETKTQYDFTTRALNSSGYSNEANVTININDIANPTPTIYDFTISLYSSRLAGYVVGNINVEQGSSAITAFTIVSGTHGNNFDISLDGVITLSDDVDFSNDSINNYSFDVKATNSSGDSNTETVTINMIYVENLYIVSAVYDNNISSTVDDDTLYIYFNQTVKSSSFSAAVSDDFAIVNGGSLGSGSVTTNNDSLFHQFIINSDSSTGSSLIIGDTSRIKIAQDTLTDENDIKPTNYIETTVEPFKNILKTGQLNSYDENGIIDANIKDDKYYSAKSLDRNFTRDDLNEIVYDNTLQFVWQDNNITTASSSWQDAITYCGNLSMGGYEDWRLPTVKELNNIYNKSSYKPALDSIFTFDNYYYWSINSVAYDSNSAWIIYSESGNFSEKLKTNSLVYTRCIHDK